LNYLILTLIA